MPITGTSANQYDPALQLGFPIPLSDLSTVGASTNQVVKFDGTTVVWANETVSPGEIALANTHVLVGNASNIAADVALSGDATISNVGAVTLSAAVRIVTTKVSLNSAQILDLNATPVTLVAAQGAGTIIVPVSIEGQMNFDTAAYDTNVNLQVKNPTSTEVFATNNYLLTTSAGSVVQPFTLSASINTDSNTYVSNEPLTITVETGNPANGAGTLDVYVTYKVITL